MIIANIIASEIAKVPDGRALGSICRAPTRTRIRIRGLAGVLDGLAQVLIDSSARTSTTAISMQKKESADGVRAGGMLGKEDGKKGNTAGTGLCPVVFGVAGMMTRSVGLEVVEKELGFLVMRVMSAREVDLRWGGVKEGARMAGAGLVDL